MQLWLIRSLGLVLALSLLATPPTARAQQFKPGELRELIVQLDRNGDKVLERDEIPESGRPAFERLLKRGDTNKDGKLDFTELRPLLGKLRALGNREAVPKRLQAMDKNKDGQVSKAEFRGPAAAFERLDTNKDGVLSKADQSSGGTPKGKP